MSDKELAMDSCFLCGNTFTFHPDRVNVIRVDPETGRPPDVGPDAEPIQPTAEATARATTKCICPTCVKSKINPVRLAAGLTAWRVL